MAGLIYGWASTWYRLPGSTHFCQQLDEGIDDILTLYTHITSLVDVKLCQIRDLRCKRIPDIVRRKKQALEQSAPYATVCSKSG